MDGDYLLEPAIRDRTVADRIWNLLLDALGDRVGYALIDAVTDFYREATDMVSVVQSELERIGRTQRLRSSEMNIRIERDSPEWLLVVVYGSWSINVDLYDRDGGDLGTWHDCGHAVSARLDPDQVAQLNPALPVPFAFDELEPLVGVGRDVHIAWNCHSLFTDACP